MPSTPRCAAASAAATIASASARLLASGFSTSTCLPASSAARAMSWWRWPGVQMSTTSMSSRSMMRAPVGGGLGPAVAVRGLLDRRRVPPDQHLLAHRRALGVEGADVAPGVGVGLAHERVADDGDAEGPARGVTHRCSPRRKRRPSRARSSGEAASGRQIEAATAIEALSGVKLSMASDAVVVDVVERGEQRRPVGLVVARGAAVVAADLEVHEVLAGPPYGVGAGALLDVEVVGVERQAEVRPEQRPEGGQPLVDGVDQRGLVAVERLDADHHVAPRRPARRPARGACGSSSYAASRSSSDIRQVRPVAA